MKKLSQILQYKSFYTVLLLFVVLYVILTTIIIKPKSIINVNEKEITGLVTDINYKKGNITVKISTKEKVIAYLNLKDEIHYGDRLLLNGNIERPSKNTLPNQFNYYKYLYNNGIYYIMNVNSYKILSNSSNVFLRLKNSLYNRYSNKREFSYINTLVLGKNQIDEEIKDMYSNIGISHLFAISGMHIYFLITVFLLVSKKIGLKEKYSFFLISILLVFYMFLIGYSSSIVRCTTCFFVNKLYKLLKIDINNIYPYLLAICLIVIIDPFIIYRISFIYSSVISFFLIISYSFIKKSKTYLGKLLKISIVAFLSSIPITISINYQINYLSVIYNLFTVPFISFIIFPFSILSFIFPFLHSILDFFIGIFESLSSVFAGLNTTIIMKKPNVIFIIVYYVILLFMIFKKKNWFSFLIIILLVIHYHSNSFFLNKYIINLDVGQGDSSLIMINRKSILIDTGGSIFNDNYKNLIKTFKALGIIKLDSIILSHGDYDHMGEAVNLVNNFKVEKVIFNCGPYNDLEQELIKVLDKKHIKYYSCIKELDMDNNKLYFLQTKKYDNENDNSNVIYTELDNYKFMFMGDASITTEKEIMNKYNLPDIDVLKVGHHGSKTSSGEIFINEINPKYSIISVGKNNRYGHPNKEVLNALGNSKIFRTDEDGSIMFKIKNNKLKIETNEP